MYVDTELIIQYCISVAYLPKRRLEFSEETSLNSDVRSHPDVIPAIINTMSYINFVSDRSKKTKGDKKD